MSIWDIDNDNAIGRVYSVDTGAVVVQVHDIELLRGVQVNHLTALRSSKPGQLLIGLITKIMRKSLIGTIDDDQAEEIPEGQTIEENILRITLIGTLKEKDGSKSNVFKRTLETVPELDAHCFVLEGKNLTAFMNTISKSKKSTEQSLTLGKYTLDENAEAYLDGNKFFQRHAVIVGSTGSGKSWTVAKVIEQIAPLPNANAILFDIHGEYSSIVTEGVQHLRIAGPNEWIGREYMSRCRATGYSKVCIR